VLDFAIHSVDMRIGARQPRLRLTTPRPNFFPLHVGRVILIVLPFTLLLVMKYIPYYQTTLNQNTAQAAAKLLSLRQQSGGGRANHNATRTTTTTIVVLNTPLGNVRIQLHPEWAPESANYVYSLAQTPCEHCFVHAAIRPKGSKATAFAGIIQGRLWSSANATADLALHPLPRGICPKDHVVDEMTPSSIIVDPEAAATNECFGPQMEKGYVAWAAGRTGPDFFINTFARPVRWWGNIHTVWGQVPLHDTSSWAVLHKLYQLPTIVRRRRFFRGSAGESSAHVLQDDFFFTLSLEEDSNT
jgi:cyclophilin family peptidyl-prolyl cis-trans isomerase